MTGRIRHIFILYILLALFGQMSILPTYAREWEEHLLSQPFSPDSLVAIDKSRQKLFYFRKNKENKKFNLVSTLPCTTGQAKGDKFKEGDLKTPEGIYFIQGKRDSGLDYRLYGSMAFILNFPNPVDQARGKTGHGIWMHGRGKPIVPYETKGCVALNNQDIQRLQSEIALTSTPVVISDAFSWEAGKEGDVSTSLIARTREWARAWDKKSSTFFSFYDPEYFSQDFKNRKKKLFSRYAWIDLLIDQIHCIEGPDYCVTYFKQVYMAPGFTSEGTKRLYWKKSSEGVWKIIGSEWFESPVGLERLYDQKVLKNLAPWLEQWRKNWERSDINAYMGCYADNAVQGDLRGRQAIGLHKRELCNKGKGPVHIILGAPSLSRIGNNVRISFVQEYSSQTGYTDRGLKTLDLVRTGEDSWNIVSEIWSSLDL